MPPSDISLGCEVQDSVGVLLTAPFGEMYSSSVLSFALCASIIYSRLHAPVPGKSTLSSMAENPNQDELGQDEIGDTASAPFRLACDVGEGNCDVNYESFKGDSKSRQDHHGNDIRTFPMEVGSLPCLHDTQPLTLVCPST